MYYYWYIDRLSIRRKLIKKKNVRFSHSSDIKEAEGISEKKKTGYYSIHNNFSPGITQIYIMAFS